MNILFVDDHTVFASMICSAFLTGHSVDLAESLTVARRSIATADRYDAVLLDFDLPDGKGDGLVQELASLTVRPLIIAFSSHEEGNAQLMAAGADIRLGKLKASSLPTILKVA